MRLFAGLGMGCLLVVVCVCVLLFVKRAVDGMLCAHSILKPLSG